ncbi:MAG TPA: hypothetical protein V6C71_08155 [Coleofasciculaceae cyanobacterium]|jgi:transposase-like protein
MKPYSIDLREKIVSAVEKGDSSVRKVAQRFGVSKNCVQRLITQKRTQGHILPRKQGGSKAFLRQFSPKTSKRVDLLIKIAIDLMNPEHLRNWFAHCCYCPF